MLTWIRGGSKGIETLWTHCLLELQTNLNSDTCQANSYSNFNTNSSHCKQNLILTPFHAIYAKLTLIHTEPTLTLGWFKSLNAFIESKHFELIELQTNLNSDTCQANTYSNINTNSYHCKQILTQFDAKLTLTHAKPTLLNYFEFK